MPEKFRVEFHLPVRHKTFKNSISIKSKKTRQNKTFRFFNSFSQNSSFADMFSFEKIFIVHELYDSFGERLRKKNFSVIFFTFDFIEQLVNFMLKNLKKEQTVFLP